MYNKKVIAGSVAAVVGLAAGGGFIASQNAANAERQEAIDVCLNSMNETRDLMAQVGDIYRPLTHHIQTGLSTNGNSFAHTGDTIHALRADLASIKPVFETSTRNVIEDCMNSEPDIFHEEEVMDASAVFEAELADLEKVEQQYLYTEQLLADAIEEEQRASQRAQQAAAERAQCYAMFGSGAWLFCD